MDLHPGYESIRSTRIDTLEWARMRGIPVHRIEYVATFRDWDDGTGVWVFYGTDEQLARAEADGTSDRVKARILDALERFNYPFQSHPNIVFAFDSDENVQANFEGSYFLRLR